MINDYTLKYMIVKKIILCIVPIIVILVKCQPQLRGNRGKDVNLCSQGSLKIGLTGAPFNKICCPWSTFWYNFFYLPSNPWQNWHTSMLTKPLQVPLCSWSICSMSQFLWKRIRKNKLELFYTLTSSRDSMGILASNASTCGF